MPGGDEMPTLRMVSFIVVMTLVVGAVAAFAQPRATLVETIRDVVMRLADAEHAVDTATAR
jgi:hypothetical protein